MRRRTSAIREAGPAWGSIEVSGTAAVPPDRCDRFSPAVLQVGEHLGRLVEASFRRFRDAEIEDSEHAPRHILARELQALHGLAERLLHHRAAPAPASPERAIEECQHLVAASQPPIQLGGVLLVRLAPSVPLPRPSVASGLTAWALRFSSWMRS